MATQTQQAFEALTRMSPRQFSINTLLLQGNCPKSVYGIHMPDEFTVEGDMQHKVSQNETLRIVVECKHCHKQGYGIIHLADLIWPE
jgi:hypothetical protein